MDTTRRSIARRLPEWVNRYRSFAAELGARSALARSRPISAVQPKIVKCHDRAQHSLGPTSALAPGRIQTMYCARDVGTGKGFERVIYSITIDPLRDFTLPGPIAVILACPQFGKLALIFRHLASYEKGSPPSFWQCVEWGPVAVRARTLLVLFRGVQILRGMPS